MAIALTIAGSDSSAGAGIQADLKTFAAHHVYGTSAITAVTAQNTRGVAMWEPVSTELVIAQIEAIATDLPPDAVKTGMLATAAIVEAVAATIREMDLPHLVVDPVMVATSGHRLLAEDAATALIDELFPLAQVLTPNIPEAEALLGVSIATIDAMRDAAARLRALGPRMVVLKGGHLNGPSTDVIDVVATPAGTFDLIGPRLTSRNTHGTGCTLSAAIAAGLARGLDAVDAIRTARHYVERAIRRAPDLGSGHGPLGHFGGTGILD